MAGSVRTLATVLRIIAGPDGVDAGVAPVPLGDAAAVDVAGLRVGWSVGEPAWAPEPAMHAAVARAVAVLVGSGAEDVGEVALRLDESLDVTQRYWQRAFGVLDASDTERQLADWDRYRSRMLRTMQAVDVVVMPATRTTAPLHRAMDNLDFIYTLPASLTGAPAVVVPVGTVDGLPIAVQVLARPWRDDVALRVAMALEDAPT
jgi:amidase